MISTRLITGRFFLLPGMLILLVWACKPADTTSDKKIETASTTEFLVQAEDFYESSHPRAEEILLIIEVCDSSILYDRQVKLPLYAQNGIPECWLVDLEKKEIQAFWQPIGEAYRFSQLGTDADILSAQNIPLKVPVKKIFS